MKAVAQQLVSHMDKHHLHDSFQSAYKAGHSTETALVRVANDLLCSLDSGHGVLLALLDLSSAFDTIDHKTLLHRMETHFGLAGTTLNWLASYLELREQVVIIGDQTSEPVSLDIGVPQGSVLGPLLFLAYVSPLQQIFQKHGVKYHAYADDTQAYVPFNICDSDGLQSATQRMQVCLEEVKTWMLQNRLKLNDNKTELLVVCNSSQKKKLCVDSVNLHLGSDWITPVEKVKNLGVIVDSALSMESHITSVNRCIYMQLRKIGKIRQYIDRHTCACVVNSLVTSRIDLNNALLAKAPAKLINRLQLSQNNAARLVSGKKRREHISPVLCDLHWLPVPARIVFKVLVLTYKCLNCPAFPEYLKELLQIYKPSRNLRSSSDNTILVVPRTQRAAGSRAFTNCAPQMWNELPKNLRDSQSLSVFKSNLKTHLFRICYDV